MSLFVTLHLGFGSEHPLTNRARKLGFAMLEFLMLNQSVPASENGIAFVAFDILDAFVNRAHVNSQPTSIEKFDGAQRASEIFDANMVPLDMSVEHTRGIEFFAASGADDVSYFPMNRPHVNVQSRRPGKNRVALGTFVGIDFYFVVDDGNVPSHFGTPVECLIASGAFEMFVPHMSHFLGFRRETVFFAKVTRMKLVLGRNRDLSAV